jgi:hypothetical protein
MGEVNQDRINFLLKESEKEEANGDHAVLADVLAEIREKAEFSDSGHIEIDDGVLEEVLSKYFS